MKGEIIDVLLHEIKWQEMTADIQVHPTVCEAGFILDIDVRNGKCIRTHFEFRIRDR